jgi:hypothetical protein
MKVLETPLSVSGFTHNVMFASINFSNDGETPLQIYENETEKINEDDEICIIEKIYLDSQYIRTVVVERNIDPNNYNIKVRE